MLKFAKNRSSSVERGSPQARRVLIERTHTRDYSPSPTTTNEETPRTTRSFSLERTVGVRRQLTFERDVTPRMISAQRNVGQLSLPPRRNPIASPPPVIRAHKKAVENCLEESDYTEVSSTTFCRLKSATLAPLTPTLEKLSSSHVSAGVKPPAVPAKSVLKNSNKYDFHRAVERLVEKLDLQLQLDTSSESGYGSDDIDSLGSRSSTASRESAPGVVPPPIPHRKNQTRARQKKVHFDSYVLLLQGIREANLELVRAHVAEVCPEAMATEEVCSGFMKLVIEDEEALVKELLNHGVNPNLVDPSGLTPLHLAAAINSLPLIKALLNRGAAINSRAHSSAKTPAELCSPVLPGYPACHAYLRCMEECLGVANGGQVFSVRPYRTCRNDELCLSLGDELIVVRKGDYEGSAWWWCRNSLDEEGYVLKDLLALNRPK